MDVPGQALLTQLSDCRGNEVVFLSHCLLDQNVRYLGGAFHRGAVPETEPLIRSGVGICQMPCPEMHAWGGVHKRMMLRAYGLRGTPLYPLRHQLLRLFTLYTRLRYWRVARVVAREIQQYRDAGVVILGVVGIGASPSCGVRTTLDLRRSLDVVSGCPLAGIDRDTVNMRAVAACRVPGAGLFTRALQKQLRKRRIEPRFVEHDLIAEMNRTPQPLDLAQRKEAS